MWALTFDAALQANRLAIVGGPRVGKTTLANYCANGRRLIHTDDYIQHDWDAVPAMLVAECSKHARYVLEGVRAPWALRAGLRVDAVLVLQSAKAPTTEPQQALAKAVHTVLAEWAAQANTPVVYC